MAGNNLSPEIWKNWERTGKSEFLKACKQIIKNDEKNKDHKNLITRYIYELVVNGIKGNIRKENVVSVIAELLVLHTEIPAVMLDILSAIDAETASDTQTDERVAFCFIVKESEKYLSDKLVKERLEIDTLQDVGILKNRNFYTKFIKVKTKLYYKQRKFNLFREESEGYAKLSVELNQEPCASVNASNILEIIKSLIGCFNLDPNRVLDIILESFETRPERHEFFIPLIRSYMNDPKIICEVLGFKYSIYQTTLEGSTPQSLYKVTALLLQHDIIALDNIYCWLVPDDKIMQKDWDKEMRDAKEYFRKLQVISIKEKDEPSSEEKEIPQDKYHLNQKFGLCQALLEIGDWKTAQQMIKKMPEHYTLEQPEIAKAMCNLLHVIIEPLYRKNCRLAPKINGRPVSPLQNKLAPKPVETFTEMRDVAIPMLVILGPSLHYDATLMYKIIRISKAALTQNCSMNSTNSAASSGSGSGGGPVINKPVPSDDNLYYDILSIFDSAILPSLSYMDCNCCIAEEIWNVLKLYPYQYRYCLYGRWKNDTNQQYPELLKRRGDAQKRIKNIMKRVSKETIKPVGRHIGKLTHCAPGFLFDYVLLQIQIYDNLINPVVDSLKYLTNLSYDVLGYCLIEALAQVHKDRFKDDSTSISSWLQSLASFCGAIFKKYNIELSGLLQFVANQLKAQKSLDLLILKEIVQKMAGIEAAEELTPEQVDAMAGGEILKGEAGQFSQIRNTKKSSQRLKEAMAEQNLAVTLCLLIAQQKFCVVYRETDNSPLKLVGKLYDQCQDTLVQFGTFLGSTMSMDEYSERLPSIQSMLQDYHIHTDVAFFLARPMFTHAINIKYDQLRKADPNCKKMPSTLKQQKYYEAVQEVMAPVILSVQPLHSSKVWEDISPQFLVTFWSLTMFDLYVPTDSYQREINKLKNLSQQALDSKDMAAGKGKKEQERYIAIMEKMQDEKKKQQEHVDKVLYRLKQEKDTWFLSRSAKAAKNETITQFLQLCLFPRCIFTAVDAVYCAKFVHTIHLLKAANFSTLLCYDRLFCDITYSVTSCTENEANRYGRFLCAMLETVMRWHSKKSVFEEECAGYPGFVTKFRVSNQFSEASDHVGYENYRHVCHKWHYKMAKAIIICLESKDYVQIRNSLIILIKILPHFPVLAKLSGILEKRIEKVREEEKGQRQDLFILATSYIGQLKTKSSSMMREAEFHSVTDKPQKKVEETSSSVDNTSENSSKVLNGDKVASEKEKSGSEKLRENSSTKLRHEKRSIQRIGSPSLLNITLQPKSEKNYVDESTSEKIKEKSSKDKEQEHREKQLRKEERREEIEREKEKRRERREEKLNQKEERQHREDRYIDMVSPKEEESSRYTSGDDQYYYMMSSNGGSIPSGSSHRRSQEMIEPDPRDVKRRKMEGNSSKNQKHEDRERRGGSTSLTLSQNSSSEYISPSSAVERTEKSEKKERSSKSKDKREKQTDEEKELRRERKLGRKRDRAVEEALLQAEQKRRKDEEKAAKLSSHQNGDIIEAPHIREKHHHSRSQEKSPYSRERDRSHDRIDTRDKQYPFYSRSQKHDSRRHH